MAKFPIERARERLGVVPTTAVRANIDVNTGGEELARAVSGLGGAVFDIGLKFHLMEADTQLDKARMQADEEHTRYMLGLDAIEDTSDESGLYNKAFKDTMATREKFMPTNGVAKRAYKSYLTGNTARWGRDTILAKRAKRKDNFRAVGFEKQTKAIQSGQFLDYFTHLQKGKMARFDAYSDEEAAKLKQNTIDQHKRFLEAQTATATREAAEKLKIAQQQTNAQLLADIWDNKLTDPNVITEALRNNLLTSADAKHLRSALLSSSPTQSTNEALIDVRYAIDGIGLGTHTRESALSVVTRHVQSLSPADGKAFIKEIFGEHETQNAFWNREAQDYMERQILKVASMTGILFGSGEQLALSARALLAYDAAKKKAAADGKPLKGKELLELAHEVMLPFRKQVQPVIPGERIPETLLPGPEERTTLIRRSEEGRLIIDSMTRPKSPEEFLIVYKAIPDKEGRRRYYEKWAEDVYK